jgi:hypothetical protein
MADEIAVLESNLARQLAWIAAADAKTGPVLTVNTAALGALAAVALPLGAWTVAQSFFGVAAVVLLALSFIHVFVASFPRTDGPVGSMVFFGEITRRSEAEFLAAMAPLDPEAYRVDLARQCYRNAQIAGQKFRHVKLATTFLLLALIPWACAIYLMKG